MRLWIEALNLANTEILDRGLLSLSSMDMSQVIPKKLEIRHPSWENVYTIPLGTVLEKGRRGLYHDIIAAAGEVKGDMRLLRVDSRRRRCSLLRVVFGLQAS